MTAELKPTYPDITVLMDAPALQAAEPSCAHLRQVDAHRGKGG